MKDNEKWGWDYEGTRRFRVYQFILLTPACPLTPQHLFIPHSPPSTAVKTPHTYMSTILLTLHLHTMQSTLPTSALTPPHLSTPHSPPPHQSTFPTTATTSPHLPTLYTTATTSPHLSTSHFTCTLPTPTLNPPHLPSHPSIPTHILTSLTL
ncbi:hypothetical protein Pcinc_027413 [Petrolisthes cinctipes]|uniref:Uncharacterized protein n=1 Tax=Petrolisthes cinctipes TaxID=88211 RepID=A0AAE1K8N5_PETCI|nr:hypothetical protein Pcinc_027413 [Petrolisthes cinctipes]